MFAPAAEDEYLELNNWFFSTIKAMFARLLWLCSVPKRIKPPSVFLLRLYHLYTLIILFCSVFKTPSVPPTPNAPNSVSFFCAPLP